MKKLLLTTVMSCAFAAQTLFALDQFPSGRRHAARFAAQAQIERARKEVREALKTDAGCQAMCEEMMKNRKSREMMVMLVEMMAWKR